MAVPATTPGSGSVAVPTAAVTSCDSAKGKVEALYRAEAQAKEPKRVDDTEDPRVRAVVRALFHPVIHAYDLVTRHVSEAAPALGATGPLSMAQAHPAAYLPRLEDAFRALSEHGLLRELEPGQYVPSGNDGSGFFALYEPGQNATGAARVGA